MDNICIKPHIPEGEDGFTVPSSDSSVSVTILLLNSLLELSLATLIIVAAFHDSSNEGGTLHLFIWGTGTCVFNSTSSYGLSTDFIVTSTVSLWCFPTFMTRQMFLASSFPSPFYDTFLIDLLISFPDELGDKLYIT